jgi:hypothetical protein
MKKELMYIYIYIYIYAFLQMWRERERAHADTLMLKRMNTFTNICMYVYDTTSLKIKACGNPCTQ